MDGKAVRSGCQRGARPHTVCRMSLARVLVGLAVSGAIAGTAGAAPGLSFEQIRGVMRANAAAFNRCLSAAARANKPLHGPFLYEIDVDKRGKVTAARPYAPSPVASFDRCVVDVLKRAKFPGGPARVEIPLVYDVD